MSLLEILCRTETCLNAATETSLSLTKYRLAASKKGLGGGVARLAKVVVVIDDVLVINGHDGVGREVKSKNKILETQ